MKKLLGVLVEIAVIFLVGFICGALWISKYQPDWTPDWLQEKGVSHSDLKIGRDELGNFDGTIKVENHEDLHVEVHVTVNVYDGDQEVGDLTGSVTLKPDSDSTVDLLSIDKFRAFDNETVELFPITGPPPTVE